MNIKRVTVGFGSTVNLGDFNSMRLDVQYEADLTPFEDAIEATAELHKLAVEQVKQQALERRRAAR